MLVANQQPAPVCVLMAEDTGVLLAAQGCDPMPHPWAPGVWVVTRNAAAAVGIVAGGGGYALDPTAALIGSLAPRSAARVVDLTAAPGGKLLTLAARGFEGLTVGADRNLGRVALLRRNLGGRGCAAAVMAADAACPPLRHGVFDLVIVDAPCSGTGTLRRHPEIRWRLKEEDLVQIAAQQRRIVRGAVELVAPGGHLLYATCSLEPEENEQVITSVPLASVPLGDRIPAGVPWIERPSGGAVVLPSLDGDGFTVHLLRRCA
jgi:16S rRNA (cytosine967-C5)-methyltransferase